LTIEDGKDEIYMRYRSYADDEEWKKELTEKVPVKIDIGAVYNASVLIFIVAFGACDLKSHCELVHVFSFQPAMRQSLKNFHPTEKELVFDIDMTDYDDIRKCCDGAKICSKCWTLMTAAVSVIHQALRGT
jgi:DNA primase small subunit